MDEHPRARTMNPGNFANNHEKAVEAGRRGGKRQRRAGDRRKQALTSGANGCSRDSSGRQTQGG